MRISEKNSLREFYENNQMYSKPLNEGFFGELFAGVVKAFASLFGIEIKDVATRTTSSYTSSTTSKERELAADKDMTDKEISESLTSEQKDEIAKDIISEKIEEEPISPMIVKLEGVPAFYKGTDKENPEVQEVSEAGRNKIILSEQDAQIEENKDEMTQAARGYGRLLGLCQYLEDYRPENFDFNEPPFPKTPGDLIQGANYLASQLLKSDYASGVNDLQKVVDFSEKYSKENDFSLKKDDSKYVPSTEVKGEQGEALAAVKEEIEQEESDDSVKELEKEIEEIDPYLDAANEENPEKLEAELEDSAKKLGVSTKEFADGVLDVESMQDLIKDKKLKIADVVAAINDAEEGLKKAAEEPEEKKPDAEESPEEAPDLEPAEIEALDPADDIEAAEKDAELPKDGVTNSLENWFKSLAKTSQDSLKSKDRIGKLRQGIFTAIDRSVDQVTQGVETAIGMWRDENEEALIKSKRFAKKNFDSLQDLVPKMVAFILKKSNESSGILHFGTIKNLVFEVLNKKFSAKPKYSLNVILEQEEQKGQEEDVGNPETDADPTDEIQKAGKSDLSAKDAVQQAMKDWGASLSKTSQQTLKSNLRGDTLNDIVGTAVDDAAAIVQQEVEKAIKDWRSEHEESLVKSKRFAKKNFDSLEKMIPELVKNIMTRANESKMVLTRSKIQKIVHKTLNKNFFSRNNILVESSRMTKLAGI